MWCHKDFALQHKYNESPAENNEASNNRNTSSYTAPGLKL